MAYVFGVRDVCGSMNKETEPNIDKMNESVNKVVAGKTWEERVNDVTTIEELNRIVFTESHRCFSDGQYDTAVQLGAKTKIWHTMEDDRVRDSHWYLQGSEVGIDDYFYTLDGDYALRPYDFMEASNNIGCRCVLEYR